MSFTIACPPNISPENWSEYVKDSQSASTLTSAKMAANRHGVVVVKFANPLTFVELGSGLESAVDAYIGHPDGQYCGYIERVSSTDRCLPHQLAVQYRRDRPATAPPAPNRMKSHRYGVYPVIATNNNADFVGLSALPAPAFGYDGSLRPDIHIPSLIIAASKTMRASRLLNGLLPHLLSPYA